MTYSEEAEKALLTLIGDGVSASADTLAEVSHTTWETQTVSINTDTLESLQTRFAADPDDHYGAFLTTPGAVFTLIFQKQSGPRLAKAFLSKASRSSNARAPRDEECLAEVANIVINAVVNTIANAVDESFLLSAPEVVLGSKSVLLKIALVKLQTAGDKHAILTYVHMASEALSSDCAVLIFMSPIFRGRLLKALE